MARSTVSADTGSAVNLMDASMLKRIQKADPDAQAKRLDQPRQLDMAAKNSERSVATISCDHAVILDTHLHIRHGLALVLQGLG